MVAKKKDEVAIPAANAVAPVYDYGGMEGAGYEDTTQDDYAMPFLGLLQALSPEVAEQTVEDAKPGLLINSVTKEMSSEVFFVPVRTQHVFVEWRSKEAGGGIVARHEKDSELVQNCRTTQEFGQWKSPAGHDIVETFYMIGYLMDDVNATEPGSPVVIPFKSTSIKPYREIMQHLRTFKARPPLFANRLSIKTVPQKNNKGSFFNFDIKPALGSVGLSLIPPTLEDGTPHPLLQFGLQLSKEVASGERKMADDSVKSDAAVDVGDVPF